MVSRHRRAEESEPLTSYELRVFHGLCGKLQWLVAQLRIDLSFEISALQGELKRATVGSLVRGNALVRRAKATKHFCLRFVPIDYRRGGIITVTDAALGNVTEQGTLTDDNGKRVGSQAGYLVLFVDEKLLKGERGWFNVIDYRSHRLTRVCRSSYAAEAYGLEEGVDAGDVVRGQLAEIRGTKGTNSSTSRKALETVALVSVVDAGDAHDRVKSDVAPTAGAQKSLAFTIAALRQVFRAPGTAVRWTHTENMLADVLTKTMDSAHPVSVLGKSEWSVVYVEDLMKGAARAENR